ncbi:MAG: hypothetical protein A3B11_00600 [Candidatus Taylorbacteria bacterium RIFCSPLOWO2_01_FULL_44_26]|uniref:Uncharacterized protein n=2 Tax=Candidatus Tayloriibacteriota TaxID=1817919 RepID=A0A1G2MLD3_9BACT|nr:MAG: hypothetical protein A3D50_00515 [Candidatus Taylorbacteria bacterium RIFCSPHIGHO2_02_FULL_44_12]OHA31184.1 MAG: hypothetical protein A3B11_00600 [Candidatus Taylorbacteria bacterium RIFCSPLOWO2_01_FULL_44_26]
MSKGRVAHSTFFTVRFVSSCSDTRIAAVASKKIFKTAVSRNKMRRRIYEAVRPLYPRILQGMNVVVFGKLSGLKELIPALTDDLHGLFVKTGILKYT